MSDYDKSQFTPWRRPYKLQIDTTTYCNAKCPQCSRTNPSKGAFLSFRGKTLNNKGNRIFTGDLPLMHVKMEDFQRAYTEKTLSDIGYIQFCPTWGDHMMHPMALEMVEHVLSHSNHTIVEVVTNGSMRDEEWWWNFASLSYKYKPSRHSMTRKRLGVIFDVDGVDQEMHSRYRRNTDLSKVLAHMKVCSEFSSYLNVKSQSILFEHNENYIEEIKELCKKHGSGTHTSVVSDRFVGAFTNNKDEFTFYDENDERQVLKKASRSFIDNFRKKDGARLLSGEARLKEKIICGWSLNNNLNIDFYGNVWPCCYFGNSHHNHNTFFMRQFMAQDYFKYNNNIFKNSLNEILKNDWWKKLPETFNSSSPVRDCVHNCTSADKEGQLRKYSDIT